MIPPQLLICLLRELLLLAADFAIGVSHIDGGCRQLISRDTSYLVRISTFKDLLLVKKWNYLARVQLRYYRNCAISITVMG